MAITVEKDGWKVSGNTIEELEIGIAAVQRALSAPSPSDKPRPGRPRGSTGSGRTIKKKKRDERKKLTLKHLRAINSAPKGLPQEQLMAALGLKHTRKIGSLSSSTNALLKKVGFEPSSVYSGQKKTGQPTQWHRGKKIEEAIQAVEEFGVDS